MIEELLKYLDENGWNLWSFHLRESQRKDGSWCCDIEIEEISSGTLGSYEGFCLNMEAAMKDVAERMQKDIL